MLVQVMQPPVDVHGARMPFGSGLSKMAWRLTALLALLLTSVPLVAEEADDPSERTAAASRQSEQSQGDLLEALAAFNRGSALMEQYEYAKAADAFDTALRVMPDWVAARFNYGLAHLNRDTQPSLEEAVKSFQQVLEADPGNPHALFCLGMYFQHVGENERALVYFGRVHLADPDDPYVAFKYAEALNATGRDEEAMRILEKVIELDPGFMSAIYRLALLYRKEKGVEAAMPLLDRFQELRKAEVAGGAFAVQKVYGTVGKYYQVLGADNHPLVREPDQAQRRILFSPDVRELDVRLQAWKWGAGAIGMPGLAVADVDRDGDLDLLLTAVGSDQGCALLLNDGTGQFSLGQQFDQPGVSAAFGDVDNDGDDDLWLGGQGGEVLWQNDGQGQFQPHETPGEAEGRGMTPLSRLVDLDSDGDLDLLAFRFAAGSIPGEGAAKALASSVYNNNRDGTYADVAEELELQLADTPIASIVCDDLDNDRDLDIVLFPAGRAAAIVWVNDRQGAFRLLDGAELGIVGQNVLSATTGDPDKDGDRDLLVCTADETRLLENRGRLQFRCVERFKRRHGSLRATGGQFVDMDNDGDLDLVFGDAYRRDRSRGPLLLVNQWPEKGFVDLTELDQGNLLPAIDTEGPASCVAADFDGNGHCDLLLAAAGRRPMLIRNVTEGGNWIAIDLKGRVGRDKMTRSNNSGIGARVEVKTGTIYQQHFVGGTAGPVASPPLRVHAGLGEHPKVDWLRIVWPDAVLQAELELAANRVATVVELSRKESSCPYLFVWDGSRFRFVGDFGGVGGLGYLVAPGVYAPPDPTEYLPLPPLAPRDGHYVLNALTVLEEVTYFDEAKLIAVDHPLGTQVLPNEMMAISVPPPQYELFCFRQPIAPRRVVDHRGCDVTSQLAEVDRRYAGATRRDTRFGGIAEPHFIELDFGDQLTRFSTDDRLILVAHGWVEYGYSSTNYAAAQAGLRTEAPSIDVWRDGQWVEVFREVGYPAGTQHVMTLEVTGKIRPGDRKIRIRSNMELYWDRIFLARHLDEVPLKQQEVAASSADLHYFGFPREYSPDGRLPNLSDYENVDHDMSWKLMAGDYTRFGDVTELVHEPDDCFVIMGHGEELTLKFAADDFGPVPEGHQRSFILKSDSYCKDMDLYTAFPDTVEPLPFHGMSGYPYGEGEHYPDDEKRTRYRREYNTRSVRVQPMLESEAATQ